jgi:[ribosomal protein S18]-alanine N-acetyltransferase
MPRCSKESVPSVRVRPATRDDIPAVMELEQATRSAAHWPRDQYEKLFAAQSSALNPAEPNYFVLIAEEGIETLAFLIARRLDTEWELENIVVAEKFRKQGLAVRLLNQLIQQAQTANADGLFLEVRESNQPARGLYRKLGFEETGRRKSYYSSPAEDAILYQHKLLK